MRQFLLALVVAMPAVALAQPNLVTNGSFEEPDIDARLTDGTTLYFYERVGANVMTGWSHAAGLAVLDSRPGAWEASDGNQYIEVESGFAASISQVLLTEPGVAYQLTFDYAPQTIAQSADDSLSIFWDGSLLDTVDLEATSNATLQWSSFSYTVTATSNQTELRFADGMIGATFRGAYVDNVAVTPTPSTAGLIGLATISLLRRRR